MRQQILLHNLSYMVLLHLLTTFPSFNIHTCLFVPGYSRRSEIEAAFKWFERGRFFAQNNMTWLQFMLGTLLETQGVSSVGALS